MEEKKISFEIPGQSQSKLRARWSGHHTYTPDKTANYKTYIKEMFIISYPDFIPLEGALRMTIIAYMMIPKSTSKKRMKLMIDRIIRPTKWSNISDILISAENALNSLAYYDNKQIVTSIIHKYYAIRPRLEIEITGARI